MLFENKKKCHKKFCDFNSQPDSRKKKDEWNLFYGFMDEMHLKIFSLIFMIDTLRLGLAS
jgi:hypothetical protein